MAEDLLEEVQKTAEKDERVLVTTLTKRMAEDLTDYYARIGVKVRYMHSEIDTLERIDIVDDLRRGKFDVLVGVNLLREGYGCRKCLWWQSLMLTRKGFEKRNLFDSDNRKGCKKRKRPCYNVCGQDDGISAERI